MQINMYEAKAQLSKLVDAAENGEEIIIARAGKPCVRLVPVVAPNRRRLGIDEGVFKVPDDFDAPLPEDVLAGFEG